MYPILLSKVPLDHVFDAPGSVEGEEVKPVADSVASVFVLWEHIETTEFVVGEEGFGLSRHLVEQWEAELGADVLDRTDVANREDLGIDVFLGFGCVDPIVLYDYGAPDVRYPKGSRRVEHWRCIGGGADKLYVLLVRLGVSYGSGFHEDAVVENCKTCGVTRVE